MSNKVIDGFDGLLDVSFINMMKNFCFLIFKV